MQRGNAFPDAGWERFRLRTEGTVFRNLRYEALHRAIKQLPEVQRRRLILYYFMGLTYAQIAEKEGCTFQAIGKSISAAEKRLKKILE